MDFKLEHDPLTDSWTLSHSELCQLETPSEFEEWRSTLFRELEKIGPDIDLLVEMGNFKVASSLADAYGEAARKAQDLTLSILRYGDSDGWTKTQVRLQAVLNNYPFNGFTDRESALEALHRIREEREGQASVGGPWTVTAKSA